MKEEHITIRQATDPSIYPLCAAMMAGSDPWITLGMDQTECLKSFEGPCKEIYLLECENQMGGFMIIQTCGSFKGYIQTLCIRKEDRAKGFGKKFLQFAEQRILCLSPNIFICVSSFNKGAIRLYEAFGFTLVGELKDFIKPGFSEMLYRKSYGPLSGYPVQSLNHAT